MLPCWPVLAVALSAAPSGPVAILDVDGPPMMMGLSGQVTKTILDAAAAMSLQVVTPDQLREKLKDPTKYEQAKQCGERTGCLANVLAPLGITAAVTGRLARDEKNYLVQLWLHDLGKLEVVADVDRAILIASRRFQRDVEQAAPALLRGEREARGTLVLKASVAGAQVFLNGDFVGAAPVTLQKKPGKYEVRFEKNKYLTVQRLVGVEANQTTEEVAALLLKPGEIPDDVDALPTLAAKPEDTQGSGPRAGLTAPTFVFAGLSLAALGVGIGFGAAAAGQDAKILASYDMARMAYAATRQDALAAQTSATVANVAYVAAGGFGLATLIFLVVDLSRPTPTTALVPTLGEGQVGVSYQGRLP